MIWKLYIVNCKDKSLYTGITTDIVRRLKEHNSGKGAKSLLGKLPVKIVYTEQFDSQRDAMKREREIKSWKKEKKLKLISGL